MAKQIDELQKAVEFLKSRDIPAPSVQVSSETYASKVGISTPPPKTTTAAKTAQAPRAHRIHLKPSDPTDAGKLGRQELVKLQQKIENAIPATELNFSVDRLRPAAKGGLIMEFRSKEEKNKALKTLEVPSAKLGLKMNEVKIVPRLLLKGIPASIKREDILPAIKKSNPVVSDLLTEPVDNLKVVTSWNNSEKTTQTDLLEATPRLHKHLVSNNKMVIGMCRYTLSENVHALHCSKCMRFGHQIRGCKATSPVCGICSGEHTTASCAGYFAAGRPKHKVARCCANCKSSRDHNDLATSHSAIDKHLCPIAKSFIDHKKALICYE